MKDSEEREALEAKRERNRDERIQRVKQWVEYIKSTPVEEWGPQQNRVVNSQLDSAQNSGLSVEHYQRVEAAGEEFRTEQDSEDE